MKTKSFTLLELIVVIAIIGILVTLLIPSLNNAHKKSKNVVCLNNYKQNNLALSLYVKDNNGFFPIQNGSQTWWVGQSGNTGKYKKKKKFRITNKPLNKYLGDFQIGDFVPSSMCPESIGNDEIFLKYGTDYIANNHELTKKGLKENRTGHLSMVEDPSRMVTFYEEATYELMYSLTVPGIMYKHTNIGDNRFNLSFVDGSVKALISMQPGREHTSVFTLNNGD